MSTEHSQSIHASPEGVAAFIDVETTGLSPYTDEIIELSVVLFRFHRATGEIIEVVSEYTGLRQPRFAKITPEVTRVHGITGKDVVGKDLDYPQIERLIREAEFLVAHNATFDRSFVEILFHSAIEKKWRCSMRHVDWGARGFASRRLQVLLQQHGIKVSKAHRADADVKYALQLLNRKGSDGTTYFYEMLQSRPLAGRTQRASVEPAMHQPVNQAKQQPTANQPAKTHP